VLAEIDLLERRRHSGDCPRCRKRAFRRAAALTIAGIAAVTVVVMWVLVAFASFPPVGQG
jgi:hypothetical protein